MSKKKSKPADPREAQLETALTSCRRLNRAVRFSFLREIIRALKCEDREAETVFEGWVRSGKVLQDGCIGEVKIYLCKGVAII